MVQNHILRLCEVCNFADRSVEITSGIGHLTSGIHIKLSKKL